MRRFRLLKTLTWALPLRCAHAGLGYCFLIAPAYNWSPWSFYVLQPLLQRSAIFVAMVLFLSIFPYIEFACPNFCGVCFICVSFSKVEVILPSGRLLCKYPRLATPPPKARGISIFKIQQPSTFSVTMLPTRAPWGVAAFGPEMSCNWSGLRRRENWLSVRNSRFFSLIFGTFFLTLNAFEPPLSPFGPSVEAPCRYARGVL